MKKTGSGAASILLLVSTLLSAFSCVYACNDYVLTSASQIVDPYLVLDQNFDDEPVPRALPTHWAVMGEAATWNFTVDGDVRYGKGGQSAKSVVTEGFLSAHRNFTEQNGTVVVTFAVRLDNATEHANFKVYIDDGDFSGANIIFRNGRIGYREHGKLICIRYPYVVNRWYRIKFIMNIPDNLYNIHVDDHLEVINADFRGSCTEIRRIIVNATSSVSNFTGYIDQIKVKKCIEIPEDFPTIQDGVDAASPGDTIFVKAGEGACKRVYFENVIIDKSLFLIGEDMATTIIDARFIKSKWGADGIYIESCNVTVYGFTIKNAEADGICIEGSHNTITNNNISCNLDFGIYVKGSNNIVSNNTISSNLECGVYIRGSNSTVTNNNITSNDDSGIHIRGSNSTITGNTINSNLERGIHLLGSNNLVKRNIISGNKVGLECIQETWNNRIYHNRFICNSIQALDDGSNIWDNDYPYQPDKKGGGNYWSDHNCTDYYSGVNQDEHGTSCSPIPDGVCDTPYIISAHSQDNYPLFIVQNVTQQPDAADVTYEDDVKVDVTVLEDVPVEEVKICVDVNSTFDKCYGATQISGSNLWRGSILKKEYCSEVTYYISVSANCTEWLNSSIYPLPAWVHSICYPSPYHVQDRRDPEFIDVWQEPAGPNEEDLIHFYANVTDDNRTVFMDLASGIDKVLLAYSVNGSWWTTRMNRTVSMHPYYLYEATMPRQPVGELHANMTVFDKAGNFAAWNESKHIKSLAELYIYYNAVSNSSDPCNIDFGVLSQGEVKSDRKMRICNHGEEVLSWEITEIEGGKWFSFDPSRGTTGPDGCVNITVTVDTKDWDVYDPCPPKCEAVVTANGTVSNWAIIIIFRVRHIIIDRSWASSEAPDRCDVNSTQDYAYHATWAHNCLDATPGEIRFSYISLVCEWECNVESCDLTLVCHNHTNYFWVDVNGTGWANFNYTLGEVGTRTFIVEEVRFPYKYKGTDYDITSFSQDPEHGMNRRTIWDMVNITLKIIDANDPPRIDVGSCAVISLNGSKYEFDDTPFEGVVVEFNDTLCQYTVGKRCVTASKIHDTKFGLTAFTSNTVCCIWDRIKIVGGCVSKQQTEEEQADDIWFTGVYEYDNAMFKGGGMSELYIDVYEECKVTIHDDPLDWSYANERWEKQYFYTSGVRAYKISKVHDNLYGLTEVVPQTTPKFQLTIMVEGNGTTDPIPGIYTYGDYVEIDVHAFPDPDWTIYHWLLDGVEVSDDDASESITVCMNDDHVLTVILEEVRRAELWKNTMGLFLIVILMIAGFTSVILMIPRRNRFK